MKKVLAVGLMPPEQEKLARFCQENDLPMSVTSSLGRKKGDYPVHIVLDAFRRHKTVRAAARVAGISPGTTPRILRQAGKL